MLLLGGNKANQTFCHGQILPQGLPNICLNNSPQELKILIDFKMLARRDGEVGVGGGSREMRGEEQPSTCQRRSLRSRCPRRQPAPGPGCAPPPPPRGLRCPRRCRPHAPSPPSASCPPPRRQTAPGHLGLGCSAKVPAVAGVGSAGRGGDLGPGTSAPFREEF